MRLRYLIGGTALLGGCAVLTWWAYLRKIPMSYDNACVVFTSSVTGSGTPKSPRLLLDGAQMVLAIPYTPSKDTYADTVHGAVERRAPRKMLIEKSGRAIEAIGNSPQGELLVRVSSDAQAKVILSDLCFRDVEVHALLPPGA
jgi:hypothetical protein